MKTHENVKEEENEKRMRAVEVLPNLRKMRAKELQMAEKQEQRMKKEGEVQKAGKKTAKQELPSVQVLEGRRSSQEQMVLLSQKEEEDDADVISAEVFAKTARWQDKNQSFSPMTLLAEVCTGMASMQEQMVPHSPIAEETIADFDSAGMQQQHDEETIVGIISAEGYMETTSLQEKRPDLLKEEKEAIKDFVAKKTQEEYVSAYAALMQYSFHEWLGGRDEIRHQ